MQEEKGHVPRHEPEAMCNANLYGEHFQTPDPKLKRGDLSCPATMCPSRPDIVDLTAWVPFPSPGNIPTESDVRRCEYVDSQRVYVFNDNFHFRLVHTLGILNDE